MQKDIYSAKVLCAFVFSDSTADLRPLCALSAVLLLSFMAGSGALRALALDAGNMFLVLLSLKRNQIVRRYTYW